MYAKNVHRKGDTSMTENEVKEVVKKLRNKAELFKNSGFAVDGIVKSFEDSANFIEMLSKEIQQYRAIGTIEQLEWCKDASHWKELFKEKLEKYEAIGTIEEFKVLKEKSVAKKVVVEHIPKTSWTKEVSHYLCPSCRSIFSFGGKPYCSNCGQKVDF